MFVTTQADWAENYAAFSKIDSYYMRLESMWMELMQATTLQADSVTLTVADLSINAHCQSGARLESDYIGTRFFSSPESPLVLPMCRKFVVSVSSPFSKVL